MRILMVVLIAFTGVAAPQDDVEAKKKQFAEIMRQLFALQKRIDAEPKLRKDPEVKAQTDKLKKEREALLNDLTAGDRTKENALLQEVIKKYLPELEPELQKLQLKANEIVALSSLKTICTAQSDFRSNDRDDNLINDFWTGDVAGLCYLVPLTLPEKDRDLKHAIRLIEPSLADADAAPLKIESSAKQPAEKPTPNSGYLFVSLANLASAKGPVSYRVDTDVTPAFGAVHNLDRFGIAAYPAEYGKTGTLTFIVNEDGAPWKKDLGGKAIVEFPADPKADGWLLTN